jgi:thiamine-phosphate pyrophosphorylase
VNSLPEFVLISDAARVGTARFLDVLCAAIGAGLPAVLLREPEWSRSEVRGLTEEVLRIASRELCILAHRDATLTRDLGLAGVHLGGGRPETIGEARRVLGDSALVGYSAHSQDECQRAAEFGADYAFFSPVLPPLSKDHGLEPVGFDGLRQACSAGHLPLYALGGLRPEHAAAVRACGAAGIAGIGAIIDASDPAAATREFLLGLKFPSGPPGG